MTIRKKIDKSDFDKVISKAGHVSSDNQKTSHEWTAISLRITKQIISDIDKMVDERVGLSRTAWILEAIQEKLKRNE